jgi:hypothetical protein
MGQTTVALGGRSGKWLDIHAIRMVHVQLHELGADQFIVVWTFKTGAIGMLLNFFHGVGIVGSHNHDRDRGSHNIQNGVAYFPTMEDDMDSAHLIPYNLRNRDILGHRVGFVVSNDTPDGGPNGEFNLGEVAVNIRYEKDRGVANLDDSSVVEVMLPINLGGRGELQDFDNQISL